MMKWETFSDFHLQSEIYIYTYIYIYLYIYIPIYIYIYKEHDGMKELQNLMNLM